ncbi:MAG: DegT/DnrJ/EryC1/StrS family aminotransferase [Granulosicoccus sp.]
MRDLSLKQETHVVVGGGFNGLMLADMLCNLYPQHRIVLLEASSECGGLLRSFDYGRYGQFDYGTHILSETGVAGLDQYLKDLLPKDSWYFLRGSKRNMAGLYFASRIQHQSSYPDLTALDDETYGRLVRNFFDHLTEDDGRHESNAHDYLQKRYGPAIADEVARPFVEKFARCPAEKLDVMVTRLCPLDRMALLGAAAMPSVLKAPGLSQRIAYVDQRDLPADECSSLASFYPKERGMQQIINALLARLSSKSSVSVHCNTSIASITNRNDGLDLTLQDGSVLQAAHIYWTANVLTAARPMGIHVDYSRMDKPLTNVLCHFEFPNPTALGDLHYLYCADPQFQTYRYTNYHAYCPDLSAEPGYSITVELLMNEHQAESARADYPALALSEMRKMGVVADSNKPLFARAEELPYGFARPTLANTAELSRLRDAISAKAISGVTQLGVGSCKNLFFMTEVLQNTYSFVERLRQQQPDSTAQSAGGHEMLSTRTIPANRPGNAIEGTLLEETGCAHFFWCGRGATALYLAYRAAAHAADSTQPGGEVILPAVSCIVPAGSCLSAGLQPRFADVDPDTGLVTLDTVKARVSERTRAVVFIHLYGQTADLQSLADWCRTRGIALIEDAALAMGARLPNGQAVGSVGDFVVHSFGPGKILDAGGGGALLVRHAQHAEIIEHELRELENVPSLPDEHSNALEDSARQLQYGLIKIMRNGGHALEAGTTFRAIHSHFERLYLKPFKRKKAIIQRWPDLARSLAIRLDKARIYENELEKGPWTTLDGWRHSFACWRYTLLVDFPDDLASFSDAVRRDGFHVSNLYWPVNCYFRPEDRCPQALAFSRRVVNLWVDESVDKNQVRDCALSLRRNAQSLHTATSESAVGRAA